MTAPLVTIPARRGKAARMGAGQRVTIVNTHGTQVVDTWAFAAGDMAEWMSMEASRASFMKLAAAVGDAFLTNQRRPILTLVEDTSGCAHDTLIAPCDAPRYGLLGVSGYHDNCRDNLHAALGEIGLTIPATPPSLNVFMNIPWTADGRLAWGEPVSTPGSHVVFRAEMDLVIAFSACPQDILPINGGTGRTTEAQGSGLAFLHRASGTDAISGAADVGMQDLTPLRRHRWERTGGSTWPRGGPSRSSRTTRARSGWGTWCCSPAPPPSIGRATCAGWAT